VPKTPKTLLDRLGWAENAPRTRKSMNTMSDILDELSDLTEAAQTLSDTLSEIAEMPESIRSNLEQYEGGLEDTNITAEEREDTWGEDITGEFTELVQAINGLAEHLGTIRDSLPEIFQQNEKSSDV
jgi:uncharacterized phage infection (PIP) family protein YhgE